MKSLEIQIDTMDLKHGRGGRVGKKGYTIALAVLQEWIYVPKTA